MENSEITSFYDSVNTNYNGWNVPFIDSINNFLSYDPLTEKRERWDHYTFSGMNVPRVTEIISATIGRGYLMKYAAKLGANYEKQNKMTLDTGTLVHAMLEDYIISGKPKAVYDIADADQLKALKSYLWT